MARRIVTRGVRGVRRRTHWSASLVTPVSVSTSGSLLLFTSPVGHEGETLIRVRGLLSVALQTASAVADGYVGSFGMAIVTTAAATAGVASIPTPSTEAAWDGWLLHRFFDCRRTLGAGSPGEFSRLELDSKAMRKANEDESLVGVIEFTETGTATMLIVASIRFLSMVG